MATDENSWRTQSFRQSVIAKIDEAVQMSGMPTAKNSIEMENHVFQKAKTKEEYLGFVARLILHVRELNTKKGTGGTASGTACSGNQGMPDPIGALQTLARQGTGNNQMMNMSGPGSNPQGIIPQPPTNTATNLLQSLNQRPGQPITMQSMQNKIPGMGMMPAQTSGPMNHMGPIQTMQTNSMLTQLNPMGQGNMSQQINQMVPNQMTQINSGQMQQNMQTQMQSQLSNQINNQITGSISGIQTNLPQQMNQIAPGQLGPGQMQQQLSHMQRKQGEMINAGFPGPRNVTPTQFLGQSPSPSAPSPAGLGAPSSNQMVASPALVPSPSPQHAMMAGPQRSVGMAPSPSSSLNTPGGVGATPSPQQEDQAYRDKVKQLSKYVEPLRRMIAKMGNEGNVDKLSKMKKLLEILSNPSKRMPLDTLLKCEVVLEKVDFKRSDASVGPPVTTLKEHHFFSPLLEAVSTHLQSPVVNHTLQRTFGPCLEALFGPEIKNLPQPLKKQKIEESPSEIPDVLQGEIARLDQRFKVSLDPAQQTGSKCIQLICWLDDRHSLSSHQHITNNDKVNDRQRIKPGSVKNIKNEKENALPAYCTPPNPCPVGYTSKNNCIVNFENTAAFSRDYQSAQDCMCDTEHMLDCSVDSTNSNNLPNMHISNSNFNQIVDQFQVEENPFFRGEKLPIAAKKGLNVY